MDERNIKLKIVRRFLRDDVVGPRKRSAETVQNWFASSDQGKVKDVIDDMTRDPGSPIEAYGGARYNIRLTSRKQGKQFLEDHGEDLPWGID